MIDLHLLHRLVFRRALALTFLSCLSFWTIAAEAIKVIRTDFVAPIELAIGVDNPSILSEWINPTSDLQKVASANQLEREFNKANREAFYKARSFFDLGKARMTNRADSAASNKWVRARAAAKEATRTAEEARVKFETAKAVAYPPPKELSLLIDHYPVEFVKPVRFDYGAKKILIRVANLPPALTSGKTRNVPVSLQIEGEKLSVGSIEIVRLVPVNVGGKKWAWIAAALLAIVIVFLSAFTSMIRDPSPKVKDSGTKRLRDKILPEFFRVGENAPPFSLARTQMAFWTVIVCWAWIYLFSTTGQNFAPSNTVLALLGIAGGTLLGARLIEKNKEGEVQNIAFKLNAENQVLRALEARPLAGLTPDQGVGLQIEIAQREASKLALEKKISEAMADTSWSDGFLNDVLSDENGVSVHRLQMVVWTVALGCVFVSAVLKDLAMPDFDGGLLALMGISSGAYLGFKAPEKHTVLPGESAVVRSSAER